MNGLEKFFKKYNILFLVVILALAIFFRLYQIKTVPPGLYPDEAMNGNNAVEALGDGSMGSFLQNAKVFYPENNGREGLFINIQALSVKFFGNEPWALRLVSAIFGILTVLGLYFLTKTLFEKESIALFASFFLATSFWHINFSRIGFRAIMAPCFLVWSLFLLFKLLDQVKNNFQSASWRTISNFQIIFSSLISGTVFGIGLHSYIAYRAAPLLLIPPFIIFLKNRNFKPIIFFIIGAALSASPLLFYFYNNPQDFFGRAAQVSIFSSESPLLELGKNTAKTLGMFFWRGDMNWRHNLAGAPELWWPVSILFLFGLLISAKKIFTRSTQKANYCLMITWFFVMLLPAVISSEGLPHALRAIIVIPVVMIFSALGLWWLIEKIVKLIENYIVKSPESAVQLNRIKKESSILLLAFFIVVSVNTFNQYFLRWAGNPYTADAFSDNYVKLGNYLRYVPQNVKKYIIINADGVYVRNFPMPSQTVMFISDTFSPAKQNGKNIFYITPDNLDKITEIANNESNVQIYTLEHDSLLRKKLSDAIPSLFMYQNEGILIQQK